MLRIDVPETADVEIVELVSSGVSVSDDGEVTVYLIRQPEASTGAPGLRLTEDDALALVDALRQAEELVSGRRPQAFIRLVIDQPERA
jgi:hypothetical protein